jgi:hypothetical protein
MGFADLFVPMRCVKRIVAFVDFFVRMTTMTMTAMSAVSDEVDTDKYDGDQDPEPVLQ